MENQVETPEKTKQNALAKLDLLRKWQEFHTKAAYKYCQLFTIFSFFVRLSAILLSKSIQYRLKSLP